MRDSQPIDSALIARLQGDAALAAACPDGVYYDEAPPNSTRFVIVSRITGLPGDVATFGGSAIEDYLYLVKAVMLSTAGGDIKAAASRIYALLEDQPLDADGYVWMTTHRTEYLRITEKDDIDPTIRWLHRGGHFRVQHSRAPGAGI